MINNTFTQGDFSPINFGDNNKVKGKKTVNVSNKQKWAFGGGFITGVLAS